MVHTTPRSPDSMTPRSQRDDPAEGTFKTSATFLGVKDGKVQLRKDDGREITVAMEALSVPDQEYVRKSEQGATPLQSATSGGQVATVKLLLEKGADVDAVNAAGLTSLHVAASSGSEAIVALLWEHGAAVAPYDASGRSPLELAIAAGHTACATLRKSAEHAVKRQLQSTEAPIGAVWLEAIEPQETLQSPIKASDCSDPTVPPLDRGRRRVAESLWRGARGRWHRGSPSHGRQFRGAEADMLGLA